jgi:hypothetical protein
LEWWNSTQTGEKWKRLIGFTPDYQDGGQQLTLPSAIIVVCQLEIDNNGRHSTA